jgi:hypothetical protein
VPPKVWVCWRLSHLIPPQYFAPAILISMFSTHHTFQWKCPVPLGPPDLTIDSPNSNIVCPGLQSRKPCLHSQFLIFCPISSSPPTQHVSGNKIFQVCHMGGMASMADHGGYKMYTYVLAIL